jgi:hypothetical protein
VTGAQSAAAGGAAWLLVATLAIAGAVGLGLIDVLFLLGPLVVVPLGLDLLPGPGPRPLLAAARWLQPPAAAAVVCSFLLPPGQAAGIFASVWLLPSGLVALTGLQQLMRGRSLRPGVVAPAAAMGFLLVGAGWLAVYRAGATLGGFSPDIVALTAVHFHFAGFGATLMGALTVAYVRPHHRSHEAAAAGTYAVVIGMPIVAGGIALSLQPVAMVGAAVLASGVVLVAGVSLLTVAPRLPRLSRAALTLSALSVVLPMILAVAYTARPVLGTPALGLHDMAATHGVLNSLGFAVLGLIGWRLATAGFPAIAKVNADAHA